MKNLFEIEKLICEYPSTKQKVLEVEELNIPKNELVVILGISGIGKSTILETLGLMNNTINVNQTKRIKFYPDGETEEIDFIALWRNFNDFKISDVRNRHFSFIFQDANFMPNFSAEENILISQLLQGMPIIEAKEKIQTYIEEFDLSDVLDKDKKIHELSGGQKQRIAFIRAISPDFTVLFGDEPTGNLDMFSARKLMNAIKTIIEKTKRTAIIVSHDINLSIEFADRLIIINSKFEEENNRKRRYGFIDQSCIYKREIENDTIFWENTQGKFSNQQIISRIKDSLVT